MCKIKRNDNDAVDGNLTGITLNFVGIYAHNNNGKEINKDEK